MRVLAVVVGTLVVLAASGAGRAQGIDPPPLPPPAGEEPDPAAPWSYGVEADFNRRYLWNGLTYNRGLVVQPDAWASRKGLTLEFWGSQVASELDGNVKQLTTVLIATYERTTRRVTFKPSLSAYLYPDDPVQPDTLEAAVALAYDVGPLSVETRHLLDLVQYGGAYFGAIGLAREGPLSSRVTGRAEGWLGWATAAYHEAYAGVRKGGPTYAGVEGSLTITFGRFYVRPHASAGAILMRELREVVDERPVNGGLAVGVSF